jgi:peptidoglycan/xylan/chitin deacetylase (PgdA/CDA1 family)
VIRSAALARRGARRAIKHAIATCSFATGALDAWRSARGALSGPTVRIVGYHRVVPDAAAAAARCMPPLCVSIEAFVAHMDHLIRAYDVCSLDDAIAVLRGERPARPGRELAVITFDDGYRDVVDHALPILRARGLAATVFLTTGVVDGDVRLPHDRLYALLLRVGEARLRVLGTAVPDRLVWPLARADWALETGDPLAAADAILEALPVRDVNLLCDALARRVGEPGGEELAPTLDWRQAARLLDEGFTIGSHGATHAHLPLEGDDELARELREAADTLRRRLGIVPRAISYPAGRWDHRVLAATRAAGHSIGVTTEERPNRRGADLLRLGRKCMCDEHSIGLGARHSPALVAAQLDGLFRAIGLSRPVPGDFTLETPSR